MRLRFLLSLSEIRGLFAAFEKKKISTKNANGKHTLIRHQHYIGQME